MPQKRTLRSGNQSFDPLFVITSSNYPEDQLPVLEAGSPIADKEAPRHQGRFTYPRVACLQLPSVRAIQSALQIKQVRCHYPASGRDQFLNELVVPGSIIYSSCNCRYAVIWVYRLSRPGPSSGQRKNLSSASISPFSFMSIHQRPPRCPTSPGPNSVSRPFMPGINC